MLPRIIRRIVAPSVTREADVLVKNHGTAAVLIAKHVATAAEGQSARAHLHRVLAEVEKQVRLG